MTLPPELFAPPPTRPTLNELGEAGAREGVRVLADNAPAAFDELSPYVERANSAAGSFSELADGLFNENIDPKEQAVEWGEAFVRGYAEDNGIPTSPDQARDMATAWAAGAVGSPYVPELPTDAQELQGALIDGCAVAVSQFTGVNPKLLVTTGEALLDGKISDDELVTICKVAGGIAGAAIGQAFGIPAPIGAYFGQAFGEYIGGTINRIIGLGEQPHEKWQRIWNETLKQLEEQRATACAAWNDSRLAYYDWLDDAVLRLAQTYAALEEKINGPIELRAFGEIRRAGSPLLDSPGVRQNTLDQITRCVFVTGCDYPQLDQPYAINGTFTTAELKALELNARFESSGNQLRHKSSQQVAWGIASADPHVLQLAVAVLNAASAWGLIYKPPGIRAATQQCPLPPVKGDYVFDLPARARWHNDLQRAVMQWQEKSEQAASALNQVQRDLIQSAASQAAANANVKSSTNPRFATRADPAWRPRQSRGSSGPLIALIAGGIGLYWLSRRKN